MRLAMAGRLVPLLALAVLAPAAIAQTAPKVARIEVKGMVCSA